MVNQAQSCDLKELVLKFIPESIGREIEKATSSIYPLQNVFIRKVKILKFPKFDLSKLMEVSLYVLCLVSISFTFLFVFICRSILSGGEGIFFCVWGGWVSGLRKFIFVGCQNVVATLSSATLCMIQNSLFEICVGDVGPW